MINKLRQKKGETLIETMVSLLIAVLSVMMLATAVLASTNINKQTSEADQKYQSQLKEVEGLDESIKKEEVRLSITFSSPDGAATYESATAKVLLYGEDESQFLSYEYLSQEDMP